MSNKQHWLENPIHPALPGISKEIVLFAGIILMAIVTRFYDLETRVMSHDESLHTYFSWLFYRGQGYQHSPMMHGPLQFHLLSLSYFLFGVTDFTARIPAVLFSIATVWMVWPWRRYLGKTGAVIAGILMVISPYMLYYGRYVRNEAFAGLSGILMLYAILRYLENGNKRYLYLVSLSLVIHFTAKETAFIYAAQALLFLGIYFIAQITNKPWSGSESKFRAFIILLAVSVLLIGGALGYGFYEGAGGTLTSTETAMPADPTMPQSPLACARYGHLNHNHSRHRRHTGAHWRADISNPWLWLAQAKDGTLLWADDPYRHAGHAHVSSLSNQIPGKLAACHYPHHCP